MLVLMHAFSYGFTIKEARRFTEEEKLRYVEYYREFGLVGVGESIALDEVSWEDELVSAIQSRPADGSFLSCSNLAWIITEDEKAALIALDKSKKQSKEAKEKAKNVAYWQDVIARCERQGRLYSAEEAKLKRKEYNDLQNEGGEGFVPHFWTVDEYDSAKAQLQELLTEVQRGCK